MDFQTKIIYCFLFTLTACTSPETKQDSASTPTPSISLSNKVFITSAGMDSACEFKELPTDFYQELVFVNDSEFVRTIHTCCGGPGEDFVFATYCPGTYKLDEKYLELTFNGVYVEHIEHSLTRPGEIEPQTTTRLHDQVVNLPPLKFKRLSCGREIYFQEIGETFADGFVSYKGDPATTSVTYFKAAGIWGKLF